MKRLAWITLLIAAVLTKDQRVGAVIRRAELAQPQPLPAPLEDEQVVHQALERLRAQGLHGSATVLALHGLKRRQAPNGQTAEHETIGLSRERDSRSMG